MAKNDPIISWQDATQLREELNSRNRYKDFDLALLIANGESLENAARAVAMRVEVAKAIFFTPLFSRLVARLRQEREQSVYAVDPDEGVESEARANFFTMRLARDMGESMAMRLKAAQMLHEARPSIRKQKLEESTIKVVFSTEDTKRLMEGFAKATARPLEAVEAEFTNVDVGEDAQDRAAEDAGVTAMAQARQDEAESLSVSEIVERQGRPPESSPEPFPEETPSE